VPGWPFTVVGGPLADFTGTATAFESAAAGLNLHYGPRFQAIVSGTTAVIDCELTEISGAAAPLIDNMRAASQIRRP